MNKQIALFLGFLILASVSSVIAQGTEISIPLVQKDPATWNPVNGGMSSTLFLYQMSESYWKPCYYYNGEWISCKGYRMADWYSVIPSGSVKKNTGYTLVYYGDATHNDEWNYVTCIASKNSGSYGYLSFGGKYNWSKFLNDGKQQKFWIVESKDLDCANNKFLAWNPNTILFETKTI